MAEASGDGTPPPVLKDTGSKDPVSNDPVSNDPIAPVDQTASDADQTVSDADQTSSDADQLASENDAESSAEDQQAADLDAAADGDPRIHERTRMIRARASADREASAHRRGETAAARTESADQRDDAATQRDRAVELRDASADELLDQVSATRARAASDRSQAATDRRKAADDREAAARERVELDQARDDAQFDQIMEATDELTGATTRSFGLAELERELERAGRTSDSLILAVLDVDKLKELNDTGGHEAGDRLLRLVGATLRNNVRPYDIVVRYGGDEFLCAMPHVDLAAARERLQQIAAELGRGEHPFSYGLAERRPDDTVALLIERADADLLARRQEQRERD